MDRQRRRKHSAALHGLYQFRRSKPDALDGRLERSAFAESLRLPYSQRRVHNVRTSRGQAQHRESN